MSAQDWASDYEDFNDEEDEVIKAGDLALVEVHGLPDNTGKAFTYRATYPVQTGQLVLVPAPEWSVRVTGRAELPGFVLGPSADTCQQFKGEPGLRDIIPDMPVAAAPATEQATQVRKLIATWRSEAGLNRQRSFDAYAAARQYEAAADEVNARADSLENVLDGVSEV